MLRALSLALPLILALLAHPVLAVEDMADRPGWSVIRSAKSFDALVDGVKDAAKASGLAVVTQAGPTDAAARRGITISGNRVMGLFNNAFAVEILALSTAAMIEAPIRVYVTENADGTATLSYKLPSTVFAPYMDEGGAALADAAARLDTIFATLAQEASQ